MIPLFLSVVCSVLIAFILKINEVRTGDRIVVLAGNYLMAAGLGFLFLGFDPTGHLPLGGRVLLFAVLVGVGFAVAFFAYMRSVREVGVALATLVARISIVVPLLASALVYREIPTRLESAGILLTFVTIGVFTRSLRQDRSKTYTTGSLLALLTLFLVLGINDFSMKIFREWRPDGNKELFLLTLFATAALFTWTLVVIKRRKVRLFDLGLGLALGVPNLFASYFLIDALHQLPGIVVYPLVNVSIIGLTVLGGILIWREHINRTGWISLGLAALSIILLSI